MAILLLAGTASAQATKPAATKPATRTAAAAAPTTAAAAAYEMFDGGRVRIAPPKGWRNSFRAEDGLSARYEFGQRGLIVLVVTPQEAVFQPDMAGQMAQTIGKRVRDVASSDGSQLLYGPRVEQDDRFFLKIRDRQRVSTGEVLDRMQIYRVMQLDLVHVVVVAYTESEEAAARIHADAEAMLDQARSGSGPRPASFRRARIRLTVPPDWTEQRSDQPNGLVATYAAPDKGAARIVLRSKIVPKAAREDDARRRVLLDELVDAERYAPIVRGAAQPRDEERSEDPRFLRRMTRVIEVDGKPWQSDLRCVGVGDVLISVAAVAPPEAGPFETFSKLADEMAASIKPLGDKPRAADSAKGEVVPGSP